MYGAPLKELAEYATEKGFPCSRSGIYNLLAPPRANSLNSQRGMIQARPARVQATTKKFHARGFFSSSLFKYWKELMTMINAKDPGVAD